MPDPLPPDMPQNGPAYANPLVSAPRLPLFSGGQVPNDDAIVSQIFHKLRASGVPAGVALQQAESLRQMMHNSTYGPNSDNLSLMHDSAAGYTILSPQEILTTKQLFANPAAAAQNAEFLSGSPTAQRLLMAGSRSWRNSDPDTQYQQARQILAEQIRAKAQAEGRPIGLADARMYAENYLGGPEAFKQELSVVNSPAAPYSAGRLSESLGLNVGLGAGIHTIQDLVTGGGGVGPTGWRATSRDISNALMPGLTGSTALDEAHKTLQQAMRSGNASAVAAARKNFAEAATRATGTFGGLGKIPSTALEALPAIFGTEAAFGRNLRGESSLDFAKRLVGAGIPGEQWNVDKSDLISAFGAIPETAAQAYQFNTLPRQLGQNLSLRNAKGVIGKGSLVADAPAAFTDILQQAFGTDAARRQVASEAMGRERDLAKRVALGGVSTNLNPFENGGALEDMHNRGLFGLIKNRFRDAGAMDVLAGGLQSGVDVLGAGARLGAQGLGAGVDLATGLARLVGVPKSIADPTLGSRVRAHTDINTATRAWADTASELVNRARQGTWTGGTSSVENLPAGPNRARDEAADARKAITEARTNSLPPKGLKALGQAIVK